MEKSKLTDLKLGKDKQGYYLTAKYLVEDDHQIKEITIPKIVLNVNSHPTMSYDSSYFNRTNYHVDLGFGTLPLRTDDTYFIEKIIKEKCTEMTVEEIEKKLGYKIKIVSEKK